MQSDKWKAKFLLTPAYTVRNWLDHSRIFPVVQVVKNPLAVQETWLQSLDWKDPLEKGMAIHSSILAWRIPWIEKLGGLQFTGSQWVRQDWATNTNYVSCILAWNATFFFLFVYNGLCDSSPIWIMVKVIKLKFKLQFEKIWTIY